MSDYTALKEELAQQYLARFADVYYVLGIDDAEKMKGDAKNAVHAAVARADGGTETALRNAFKAQMQDELDEARNSLRKAFAAANAPTPAARPARPRHEEVFQTPQPKQYSVTSGGPRFT